MNTALVNKYKTEFDIWLKKGKILFSKDPKTYGFEPVEDNNWDYTFEIFPNMVFIIDDEYIEFRIAKAKGKQIQQLFYCGLETESPYYDWKPFGQFGCGVQNYRIKSKRGETTCQ